ncbi:DUF3408 domain-containing protein [Dysgonomonas sp. 216]|uniref:DUF3408 domain-containing protein n=1 Tax=Dysgonomonas sp. 216 TaxID=2302934 RepID=UPI0013D5CB85|nr:DUF3408 domain-containing protein [Dysgonomonas sp. 216]NDW18762.1 DUF3408 domain-containing protein [Dysgonomonas sp. 216]
MENTSDEPKNNKADFRNHFIIPASIQMLRRKCVYTQEDYVELIGRLATVNPSPKITIGGYVNAILQHHFEVYKDEIEEFYNNSVHKPLSL